MMRYNRILSKDALGILKSNMHIIEEIKSARLISQPFALDIHIRENNELMVYHGTTCLLTIKINLKTIKFSANKTYNDPFLIEYKIGSIPKNGIKSYLEKTIKICNNKYFANKSEGYYQNLMCYYFGEIAEANAPFIIIDRECVIGFENEAERQTCFKPISEEYNKIKVELQKENEKRWGKFKDEPSNVKKTKSFGNELDMLAIDKELNLYCIELKHSKNGSGISWAPLQVAVYRAVFKKALNDKIFKNIIELIFQKNQLGLLPNNIMNFISDKSSFADIKSLVAIGGEINDKMSCWKNMEYVINLNIKEFNRKVFIVNENKIPFGAMKSINNGQLI